MEHSHILNADKDVNAMK